MNNQIELNILDRQLVADGMLFDDTGPYERLVGKVQYSIDPDSQAHSGIVDLENAPRNSNGLVEFTGDFIILKDLRK